MSTGQIKTELFLLQAKKVAVESKFFGNFLIPSKL